MKFSEMTSEQLCALPEAELFTRDTYICGEDKKVTTKDGYVIRCGKHGDTIYVPRATRGYVVALERDSPILFWCGDESWTPACIEKGVQAKRRLTL